VTQFEVYMKLTFDVFDLFAFIS